jgi:flagellar export protein FliJ
MKKFKFKFAAVERVRKEALDSALRGLAQAQRAFQSSVARKQELQRELEGALIRRESLGSDPVGPVAFQLENAYISGTKQRIVQQEQAIFRASRGVERALRAFLHARKQMRMVETLREKALADYKKARSKYLEKQQADLYVMRARMKAIEEEATG